MKMKRHGLSFWLATVLVAVGASLLGAVLSSKYVVRLLANLASLVWTDLRLFNVALLIVFAAIWSIVAHSGRHHKKSQSHKGKVLRSPRRYQA